MGGYPKVTLVRPGSTAEAQLKLPSRVFTLHDAIFSFGNRGNNCACSDRSSSVFSQAPSTGKRDLHRMWSLEAHPTPMAKFMR
jgi:hypothetical protein